MDTTDTHPRRGPVRPWRAWLDALLRRLRAALPKGDPLRDPVTGLPDARHAGIFLDAAVGTAARGRNVAVVLFRLDGRDTLRAGHGARGVTRAIQLCAHTLQERARRQDLVARMDDASFLVVLIDCRKEQAEAFAREIQARLAREPLPWGAISVSAAVGTVEPGQPDAEALVAAVREALQRTARRGSGQVVVLAPGTLPKRQARRRNHGAIEALLEGIRILLVDDDTETLGATARLLGRLGAEVEPTASPQDALDRLTSDPGLDILVTDIVMPDMSGFTLVDLAARVRPRLPVLYISGFPQEDVYWGGTLGARSAFLGKPLEAGQLQTAILQLLDRTPVSFTTTGEKAAPPAPSRPEKILVVDDDEAVVGSLQKLFARAGYPRPQGITDPTKVRGALQRGGYDLMILDLHMPGLDGFQVLRSIQGIFDEEDFFPILVITGDDDPQVRRHALAAGAMDFLAKPFDPAEAEARVRNLLATRFLTRRVARQRDTLEERVMERTAELADTRWEILKRLARAGEYRDDVTGRHAERVGLLSSRLAEELGLEPREVDLIRRTAPLHDIGKIGVPDAILRKPGRLTPAEFEVMKSHTTIGAQILGGSRHRLLEVAGDIALCHHERWDGQGYPGGRAGEDIPLAARIVAVADTFDTIAHARPYKDALTPSQAIDEIVRCRGTHYDPRVVGALESIRNRVGPDGLHGLADPLDPLRDTMGLESLATAE